MTSYLLDRRDWGQEKKEPTEDEMAGWHHWLDGRESEWTQGVGDGQGGLACCDSWGCKELDTTERLNWTELNELRYMFIRGWEIIIQIFRKPTTLIHLLRIQWSGMFQDIHSKVKDKLSHLATSTTKRQMFFAKEDKENNKILQLPRWMTRE